MTIDHYTVAVRIEFDLEVEVDPREFGEEGDEAAAAEGVRALQEAIENATTRVSKAYAELSEFSACIIETDEVTVRHHRTGGYDEHRVAPGLLARYLSQQENAHRQGVGVERIGETMNYLVIAGDSSVLATTPDVSLRDVSVTADGFRVRLLSGAWCIDANVTGTDSLLAAVRSTVNARPWGVGVEAGYCDWDDGDGVVGESTASLARVESW